MDKAKRDEIIAGIEDAVTAEDDMTDEEYEAVMDLVKERRRNALGEPTPLWMIALLYIVLFAFTVPMAIYMLNLQL